MGEADYGHSHCGDQVTAQTYQRYQDQVKQNAMGMSMGMKWFTNLSALPDCLDTVWSIAVRLKYLFVIVNISQGEKAS